MIYDSYAEDIIKICKKAGDHIKEVFDYNPGFINYDIKKSGDVVSRIDIEVEAMIKREILLKYPESGFICEESGMQTNKDSKTIFFIDPIDGTFNFVNGLPFFAISVGVAVIKNGESNIITDKDIVAGVIYSPILQELFWAVSGSGAFFQGKFGKKKALKIRPYSSIYGGLFTTGSFKCGISKESKLFSFCNEKNLHFRVFGSISLELANVAMGRSNMFASKRAKPWDLAAGSIIVRESGGIVSDFDLKDVSLSSEVCEIICSHKDLHTDFFSKS